MLYYVNGLMMTNLCGYGNHLACDSDICECPHHEESKIPDPEPEPDETEQPDEVDGKSFRFD